MNGVKASGPDVFSMNFFQTCSDVIKINVMKVFLDFHQHGKFERIFNATFITLIPKKVGIVKVHPISLVCGGYKIIAKVLANSLKIVLDNIISKTHNAL